MTLRVSLACFVLLFVWSSVWAQAITGRVLPAPGENELPPQVNVTLEFPTETFEETVTVTPKGKFHFTVSAGAFFEAFFTVKARGYQTKRIHIDPYDRFPSSPIIMLGTRLPADGEPDTKDATVAAGAFMIEEGARKEHEKAVEDSKKRNYKEALKHIDKAVEIQPDYADAHNIPGTILIKLGQTEDAEAAFLKAFEQFLETNQGMDRSKVEELVLQLRRLLP